jgi:hypothetical protein
MKLSTASSCIAAHDILYSYRDILGYKLQLFFEDISLQAPIQNVISWRSHRFNRVSRYYMILAYIS